MSKRVAMQIDSLARAKQGQSMSNYPAIIAGFMARGIPAENILPRENVFTFNAWKAAGRVVRRGEHGVKVTTWISYQPKGDPDGRTRTRPRTAHVFHVSQTDPL